MNGFKISLKANEKIYINGAIIRFDRKTSMEILNDVDFLLENHILQAEDATTPLKQLYFVVQLMLMTPNDIEASMTVYRQLLPSLLSAFENDKVVSDLKVIDQQVHEKRYFEAMRGIRQLFPIESAILDPISRIKADFEKNTAPLQRAVG
ncbi:flagellar biosynthesis repressor FlbT [Notoacmeibacter sp. MSK16QG-6]|uniref:flagellar biosynthesis repressor FlbT n=1 Tax=Notoacmeibacter sp. MSK16QG-6 TaxID=2957982 RepID=UPI00209CD078|nr:flagellar biosynthesis repressor FlbT [Notoacmeibacter sp. MSK16QG-6]MCP1200939.1 flagellar biosynthesis repressor FlbT [Notoacmeibacter sp. MSK16QG-6]